MQAITLMKTNEFTLMMAQSSPEALAQAIGTLTGIALVVIFGIYSIVQAFRRRTAGWIILGAVSAIFLGRPIFSALTRVF
jgi:hypothetical protein